MSRVDAILAFMGEQTASLESISPNVIARCIESNASVEPAIENISPDIFNVFNFLLLCPPEWIGRAKAKEFAKRAALADVMLWYSSKDLGQRNDLPAKIRQSAKLKTCSARLALESGSGSLVG
jgi:hypothetical protein